MLDTAEFIGSDHIIHVVDSNGNIWPPIIPGGFMNSSNTDHKAKQIQDHLDVPKEEEKIRIDDLWLLKVRQDAIRAKNFRILNH